MTLINIGNITINAKDYCKVQICIEPKDDPNNNLLTHVGYGLVPIENLDEIGRLKKHMNLMQLLFQETIEKSIEQRVDLDAIAGMNESQICEYFRKKFSE